MYSIIATAALFTAVIFNDEIENKGRKVRSHAIFGALAITIVSILWYLDMEFVGWGLLIVPILALFISFILVKTGTTPVDRSDQIDATEAVEHHVKNIPGPYIAVAPHEPSTIALPVNGHSTTSSATDAHSPTGAASVTGAPSVTAAGSVTDSSTLTVTGQITPHVPTV